jgi:hypothetical protein
MPGGNIMMSKHEKVARYQLAVVLLALAGYLVLWPLIGPQRATGASGILGLLGFTPFFYLRRKGAAGILWDERDRAIQAKATAAGMAICWVLFFLTYPQLFFVFRGRDCVPIEIVMWSPWVGIALFFGVQSLSTIIQYRRAA